MSSSLFQLYERQRDLFFLTQGLAKSVWLDHSQFLRIWQVSVRLGVENLFTEILARNTAIIGSTFCFSGDRGCGAPSEWLLCVFRGTMVFASGIASPKLRAKRYPGKTIARVYLPSFMVWLIIVWMSGRQFLEWSSSTTVRILTLSLPLLPTDVQRLSLSQVRILNGWHYCFNMTKQSID